VQDPETEHEVERLGELVESDGVETAVLDARAEQVRDRPEALPARELVA
jgi:hypothetical protein